MEHNRTHAPTPEAKALAPSPATFASLGISANILALLEKLSYTSPTPIQQKAIPVAIEGKDVVGIAQTGTGKSLAFGIPLMQRLLAMNNKRGLIVLPTRELALQINETMQKIGKPFGLKTATLIGGASMFGQVREIRSNPHIIIGTPGRINDHIKQKNIFLGSVAITVLDEADAMLDMGFAPQIKEIMQHVPKERQTMLFSATMPDQIMKMAAMYMKLPVRVEIARQGTTSKDVDHELFIVRKDYKASLLQKLLEEYKGSVLVFCRTKHSAKKIALALLKKNFTSAEIHSNRSLVQRRQALDGFKTGKYRVLVATDIAARGIDVKGIELVINYDIPENPEDYVHRIGRTGRAGMKGKAISFVMPEQKGKVRLIERLIRSTIPVLPLPQLPDSYQLTNTGPTPQQAAVYERNKAFNNHYTPQNPNSPHKPFHRKPFNKGFGNRPKFKKPYSKFSHKPSFQK